MLVLYSRHASSFRRMSRLLNNVQGAFLWIHRLKVSTKDMFFYLMIAACLFALSGCASNPSLVRRPSTAVLRSADQGNPVAEYYVGIADFDGATSSRERKNGLEKILRAANQNLAMAQDFMGRIYMEGRGVPQNTTVAMAWLNRAAEYGAPAAQLELGNLYAAGEVVPTDNARAYFWFSVLARHVHSNVTIYNITHLQTIAATRRDQISDALKVSQLETIRRRVEAWHPKRGVPYSAVVASGTSEY